MFQRILWGPLLYTLKQKFNYAESIFKVNFFFFFKADRLVRHYREQGAEENILTQMRGSKRGMEKTAWWEAS
jgi:hypothetical protein